MPIPSDFPVFNQALNSIHEYASPALAKMNQSRIDAFEKITYFVKEIFESAVNALEKKEIMNHFRLIKNQFMANFFFQKLIAAQIPEAKPILRQEKTVSPPQEVAAEFNILAGEEIIDVPDKGNCLFDAISAGIKLNYPTNQEIQNKLNWAVDPALLKGNLKINEKLLEEPSLILRRQANDFLRANYRNENFMMELTGAIMECNDSIQRRIHNYFTPEGVDEEAALVITKGLEDDYNGLLVEGDFIGYLDLSKEKGFFCGNTEIAALSQIYQIPIEVRFENGGLRTFNLSQSKLPPLILNHGHNHFQLLLRQ